VTGRTVHSQFDWVFPWYEHYTSSGVEWQGKPLLGTAWRDADLIGLAPLVHRTVVVSRMKLRCIDMVGYNVQSGEFLVVDDFPGLVGIFVDSIINDTRFDLIRFNGFFENSEKLRAVKWAAKRNGLSVDCVEYCFPVVNLENGYAAYYAARSTRFRRAQRRQEEQAQNEYGGWSLERYKKADVDVDLDTVLERVTAVYNSSWKATGGRVLPENHRLFYADIARRFARKGKLGLSFLKLGNIDAAFFLALEERGVVYDVFISFDDRFRDLRPGEFLMKQLLPLISRENIHTLVSHGEHAYKKVWSTDDVPQRRVHIYSHKPRAVVSRVLKFKLKPLMLRLAGRI